MGKDGIEGAGTRAKGSVKEAIGKVTGNAETEAEGAAQKSAAQRSAGGVRAAVGTAENEAQAAPNGD